MQEGRDAGESWQCCGTAHQEQQHRPPPPLPPPPSPSHLRLAACSYVGPASFQAPRSMQEALDALEGMPQPVSPVAAGPAADSDVRRAFAAGQHRSRRRVTPEQRRRERQRVLQEQEEHLRTVEQLERPEGSPAGRRAGRGAAGSQRREPLQGGCCAQAPLKPKLA